MAAILRTHGGLGNQIFQVLYGRLFAEEQRTELHEVHDTRYRHKFQRSAALPIGRLPLPRARIISAARFPKMAQRFIGREERPIWIFGDAYLDGYFQKPQCYATFQSSAIRRHLLALKSELSIPTAHKCRLLVHLRLGDFFEKRADAYEHALQRLSHVPSGACVITNDELLLLAPAVSEIFRKKELELISTAGNTPEEVLRTMASYRTIDANDSTLTFWASVLGGSQVTLAHPILSATKKIYARALAGPCLSEFGRTAQAST